MSTGGFARLPTPPDSFLSAPMPVLMVVPSGVGCDIGGYAGDAMPAARLLAAASGCLITHPNVMNAASLYWSDPRIHYVEGYSLDRFAAGEIALQPVRQQRIGLLFDAAIPMELRQRHLQVADGCRASLGLNIGPVVTTDVPLNICITNGPSGVSWGEVGHPDSLIRAGEKLKRAGVTAIAVVTRFPDDSLSESSFAYRHGNGVDSLAGAEAVISHLLVKSLGIPCAHAPALEALSLDFELDPRAAGEELGYTFLPSVLVGLNRAPNLLPTCEGEKTSFIGAGLLSADQLGAMVAPEGVLGGEAILAGLERGVPLITVVNAGKLRVTASALGLQEDLQSQEGTRVVHASSYAEAAGFLMLLREGITLDSVQRPIPGVIEES